MVLGAELLPETDAPEMDFKAVVEKGVGSSKRREGRKRGSDQRGRGSGRRSGGEVGGDVRSGGGIGFATGEEGGECNGDEDNMARK